jgi:hypothetical protein
MASSVIRADDLRKYTGVIRCVGWWSKGQMAVISVDLYDLRDQNGRTPYSQTEKLSSESRTS